MGRKSTAIGFATVALCSSCNLAMADEKMDSLEKEVAALKKEITSLKYNDTFLQNQQSALSEAMKKVSVNGFLNVGYSTLDGGDSQSGISINGTRDTVDANNTFVAGLQFDAKITDSLRSSIQMTARGPDLSKVEASWAYFAYDVTDSFTVRGGRLRLPFYAYSESIDVGYTYPWTKPPVEVYSLPLNNYEGFDANYNFSLGDIYASAKVYFGSTEGSAPSYNLNYTLHDLWGVALNFTWDDLTARISYNHGTLMFDPWEGEALDQLVTGLATADVLAVGFGFPAIYAAPVEDVSASFLSASLNYDDGNWFVGAEITQGVVESPVYPMGEGGHLTLGYTFGSWMPYATVSKFYSNSKSDDYRNDRANALGTFIANGLLPLGNTVIDPSSGATAAQVAAQLSQLSAGLSSANLTQESYSMGVNYTVTRGLKLKFQVTQYSGFDDTNGLFSAPPGVSIGDKQTEYTFMANMVY